MRAQPVPLFATALADRVVAVCQPLALLMFGSWAKGQATVHSDVDLIVLMERPPSPRVRAEIEDALTCVPMHVDTLVWTARQLESACSDPLGFEASALRSAQVLYLRDDKIHHVLSSRVPGCIVKLSEKT